MDEIHAWKDKNLYDVIVDGTSSREQPLRHVIVHEIYHIGQISVWTRELNIQPVSANLIGRGL